MADITQALLQQKRALERSISNLISTINRINAEKAELQAKRSRLIVARNRIASAKYSFRSHENQVKRNIEDRRSWKGRTYNSFKGKGRNLIEANQSYERAVDRVHDAMNLEISNLERQIAHRTGLISSANAEINHLRVRILNLFN